MNALDPSTVAEAVVGALPSPVQLSVAPNAQVDPYAFAQAVAAEAVGTPDAALVVLVSQALVDALKGTPLGDLNVADASQPALDAAAEVLGASVRAAQAVSASDALAALGPDHVAVALTSADGTNHAAVLVSSALLRVPSGIVAHVPGMEMLHGVVLDVTVELGRTRMSVRELLSLSPGAVLELDRAAGSPADLLVNGRLIARGEVVVVDEDFALRVTEVPGPQEGS